MTYTVSADQIVRKKTIGITSMFILLSIFYFSLGGNWIWQIGFFIFFLFILLYTYLHKPSKYEVQDEKITIRRPVGNVEIKIQDIARIDPIHHDLLKNVTKGGAFGYLGKYDTDLGPTKWYATRRDNLVLITKTDQTKIILTPDQRYEFIEQVENELNKLTPAE